MVVSELPSGGELIGTFSGSGPPATGAVVGASVTTGAVVGALVTTMGARVGSEVKTGATVGSEV